MSEIEGIAWEHVGGLFGLGCHWEDENVLEGRDFQRECEREELDGEKGRERVEAFVGKKIEKLKIRENIKWWGSWREKEMVGNR